MLYVSISYVPTFEAEIKSLVEFEKLHQEIKEGFAKGLLTPRAQLIAVLNREGVHSIDIIFEISIWKERFMVMIYAYPFDTPSDRPQILFPLNKPNSIIVPFDFSPLLRSSDALSFTCALEAAKRFASDLAREGIPADINKNIVEIARVLRKGFQASAMQFSVADWIKLD